MFPKEVLRTKNILVDAVVVDDGDYDDVVCLPTLTENPIKHSTAYIIDVLSQKLEIASSIKEIGITSAWNNDLNSFQSHTAVNSVPLPQTTSFTPKSI